MGKIHVKCADTKTKRQWQLAGYKPKAGETGVIEWTNQYCNQQSEYFRADQMEPMTDSERNAIRDSAAQQRKEYRVRAAKEQVEREEQLQEYRYWNTACQCLEHGLIPTKETPMKKGNKFRFSKSDKYFYYDSRQCKPDTEKAKEIEATFPKDKPYDGRAWWM